MNNETIAKMIVNERLTVYLGVDLYLKTISKMTEMLENERPNLRVLVLIYIRK